MVKVITTKRKTQCGRNDRHSAHIWWTAVHNQSFIAENEWMCRGLSHDRLSVVELFDKSQKEKHDD